MSKYRWTSKVSNAQYHKETDTYTYTEETTDPVRRDILSEISNTIWMNRKAVELLDSQGRHRSQWAYAPYDGRSWKPPLLRKTPMREEKFALYASIVMLIILGIGVLGFALG